MAPLAIALAVAVTLTTVPLTLATDGTTEDAADMVYMKPLHPDTSYTGQIKTVSVHVSNKLDVPILVEADLLVDSTSIDICSITSFATSGGTAILREHGTLLMPAGYPKEFSFDDTMGISAEVSADVPGTCSMKAIVTVGVGDTRVGIHEETFSFSVQDPPPSSAKLGDVNVPAAGRCGTKDLSTTRKTSATVSAGTVEVSVPLTWVETCPDWTDWAQVLIEYRDDADGGKWKAVGGATIADDGTEIAAGKRSLSAGEHVFRVKAYYLGAWFDGACIAHMMIAGGAIGALGLAVGNPTPIGKAEFVFLFSIAVGAGYLAVEECKEAPVLDSAEWQVTVKAEDSTGGGEIILPGA